MRAITIISSGGWISQDISNSSRFFFINYQVKGYSFVSDSYYVDNFEGFETAPDENGFFLLLIFQSANKLDQDISHVLWEKSFNGCDTLPASPVTNPIIASLFDVGKMTSPVLRMSSCYIYKHSSSSLLLFFFILTVRFVYSSILFYFFFLLFKIKRLKYFPFHLLNGDIAMDNKFK